MVNSAAPRRPEQRIRLSKPEKNWGWTVGNHKTECNYTLLLHWFDLMMKMLSINKTKCKINKCLVLAILYMEYNMLIFHFRWPVLLWPKDSGLHVQSNNVMRIKSRRSYSELVMLLVSLQCCRYHRFSRYNKYWTMKMFGSSRQKRTTVV